MIVDKINIDILSCITAFCPLKSQLKSFKYAPELTV